jgi:AAA+ superfamily predicted ATPase
VVNVLLEELESFRGVVIFATNLAASFDPAFERRIRTQILFEMPGVSERERIWRAQMHPRRTPLHQDVDFRRLAEQYEVSGGDIRNAVLKAAAAAALEPADGESRVIRARHLEQGVRDVLAGKRVMQQSLFAHEAQPTVTLAARWQWWALPLSAAALVIAVAALIAALTR